MRLRNRDGTFSDLLFSKCYLMEKWVRKGSGGTAFTFLLYIYSK